MCGALAGLCDKSMVCVQTNALLTVDLTEISEFKRNNGSVWMLLT
jgi:hypothetical protein